MSTSVFSHGMEAAEPAEMAETGEVPSKSGRDAETGFWVVKKVGTCCTMQHTLLFALSSC